MRPSSAVIAGWVAEAKSIAMSLRQRAVYDLATMNERQLEEMLTEVHRLEELLMELIEAA